MAPALDVQRPLTSPSEIPQKKSLEVCPGTASNDERVRNNVITEMALADKYGAPDVYLNSTSGTVWYLWRGTIWVKPLRFEAKTGTYVIALKTDPAAELGKHRHRGPVTAFTVRGSWGYAESEPYQASPCSHLCLLTVSESRYNWTSRAGDYVVENPGTIHTLSMGDDTEVVFTVGGSIEFFEEDGTLREIMDLFSFWRMYVEHCQTNGIPINEKLWF